jgi:hypothetical protein
MSVSLGWVHTGDYGDFVYLKCGGTSAQIVSADVKPRLFLIESYFILVMSYCH